MDEGYPDDYTDPALLARPGVMQLTLGTSTTGLWCKTCLLPSRYEVPLYVLLDDGPLNCGSFSHCDGHES